MPLSLLYAPLSSFEMSAAQSESVSSGGFGGANATIPCGRSILAVSVPSVTSVDT